MIRAVHFRRWAVLELVALVGIIYLGSLFQASAELATGAPAPAFKVASAAGPQISLSDYKGKTVVIEWTNPDCPYVKKHYDSGNMQKLQQEAATKGIVWLTVTSASPGKQGYVNALEAQSWVDRQKATPKAILLDPDGRMADAYGVTLALHMFVIDPQGHMAYQGAVDDKPTSKIADVAGANNYVRTAMAAVAAGAPPKPSVTRPYGCSAR